MIFPEPVASTRPERCDTARVTSDVGGFGADHPEAYIPGDRRRALREGRDLPDRAHGAALFADISGFTPLTERLVAAYGPRRGAEELSAALEVVFDAVLAALHRHGGAVIYFSGDAVSCWLDGDDGTLAVAAGLAMQVAIAQVGALAVPGGAGLQLAMKVAVAVGPARRYVVGDPEVQLVDVLAGRLMDVLAGLETLAGPGDVVLDAATAATLAGRLAAGPTRTAPDGVTGVVVTALTTPVEPPPLRERVGDLPEAETRRWLLPAVYERLRAGRGDFLTELRPTVPVFVRFGGIDHDDDPDAPAELDAFVRQVQHVVDGYGGNLLQLTIGDKGAYLYLVFGAPIAHEDDAARACAAALDLLPLARTTAARDISVGIARGGTRAGTSGHRYRRTFTCLGDPVNLAARLMARAPAGEVYVSEAVAAATGTRFGWGELEPMTVKGKAEPVRARRLVDARRAGAVPHARRDRPMVGRDDVLADIRQLLHRATQGRGQVVGVTGEAGLGKSRLVAEVLAGVDRREAGVAVGEAQTFGVPTAYSAWRGVALDLFGLPADADAAAQTQTFTAALTALDPELLLRAPLLGALTGTDLPDNELTAALTPDLRKGSLELLVAQLFQRRARRGPLVVVLEDVHALDPLSADLLDVVLRGVATLPVLVLLAYRPSDAADPPGWLTTVRTAPHAREIALAELTGDAADALVDATARRLLDLPGEVPAALRGTVLQRTQGNPFHIEELLAFVGTRGVDVHAAAALAALDLPDSLESLVLSRIDALPEQPRRTAKVASVVGRVFDAATVDAAAPDLTDLVAPSVLVLTERDLVVPEPAPTDVSTPDWAFRHVVVRDVAYDSLPWAVRATLHDRIGHHVAAVAGPRAEDPRVLDLLAHHHWHGRDDDRKRDVLARAGAAARTAGANAVAALHLSRLLTLVDDAAAPDVLADLGEAQERAGAMDDARATRTRALELAVRAGRRETAGGARVALADLARRGGDFTAAAALLEVAEADFAAVDDDAGLGRVLHLRGTLAGQQGRLDEARQHYGRSLVIRRRIGDRAAEGSLLANLGMMAEYDGDYPTAIALTEQALAVREEVGDRWAVGHAHSNLGMLLLAVDETTRAIASLTEALRLHREVGDLWMIAIGHENLGVAELRVGDLAAAARDLGTCVEAHRLMADPWSTAHLLEDVARLAARSGQAAPVPVLVGAADRLRERIGSPRSQAQVAALAADVGDLVDDDDGRARGRALRVEHALDLAATVCVSGS